MGENKTDMRFMTRDAIKYLAIVAMTLDHIAYIFLEPALLAYGEAGTASAGTMAAANAGVLTTDGCALLSVLPPATIELLYRLFLCIGTFTGPVMIYFLIEGYFYTHDVRRYAKRLLLFALLSQLPFSLASGGFFGNMLFTLLICLGVLHVHDHVPDGGLRKLLYVLLFFVSLFTDWNFLSVPLVLFLRPAFHPTVQKASTYGERGAAGSRHEGDAPVVNATPIVKHDADQPQNNEADRMNVSVKAPRFYVDPAEQRRGMLKCVAYFLLVSCLTKGMFEGLTEALGMVLGFVCITCFYNGQQAKTHRKFHKYFFYIYYPAHLLVLWALHAI